ncbi:MAG TPA: AAA family ATPase [Dehalococcoidia bacterium]|jgi:adenylylsulfate kinase-like enzyme|nr:AAA family ATPase [Dehalococcoidia bacterium]
MNEVSEIWLITGIPGAGKSTVARLLAENFERAAYVEGDVLRRLVVNGIAWPEGRELEGEAERQFELAIRNQCLLARSFSEAGFLPILDGVIVMQHHLDAYTGYLAGGRLRLVVLAPSAEVAADRNEQCEKVAPDFSHLDGVLREQLTGQGLWIDSSSQTAEQTVAAILADLDRTLLA